MDVDPDLLSLWTKQTLITDRVRAVALRMATGLYLYGRPGTSKTHTVCTTLKGLDAEVEYHSGRLTAVGLFALLEECSDRILVLDDVSSVFRDPNAIELLLAALGTRPQGRQIRYKTARQDRTVTFTGGIIALSNLSLDNHGTGMLQALNDRIPVIRYEPTDAEIVALMRHTASGGIHGLTPNVCHEVLEFLLAKSQDRGIRPSMRLLIDKAIPDYQLHLHGQAELDWRDLIIANLEQQLIQPAHPLSVLGSEANKPAELEIVRELLDRYVNREDRLQAWKDRTGKSQATFYRRLHEFTQAERITR